MVIPIRVESGQLIEQRGQCFSVHRKHLSDKRLPRLPMVTPLAPLQKHSGMVVGAGVTGLNQVGEESFQVILEDNAMPRREV